MILLIILICTIVYIISILITRWMIIFDLKKYNCQYNIVRSNLFYILIPIANLGLCLCILIEFLFENISKYFKKFDNIKVICKFKKWFFQDK